jgi:hypothetical protein
MKRNDVIKEIHSFLINYENRCMSSDMSEAILFLEMLEKLGMEPPKIASKLVKDKDYPWGGGCAMRCNCEYCNKDFLVNAWENETI